MTVPSLWAGPYETAIEHYEAGEYPKAKTLFEQAAAEGNREAKYRLGQLYESGLGVEQNLTAAMQLYKEASPLLPRNTENTSQFNPIACNATVQRH
jgi:TPR repeat protein